MIVEIIIVVPNVVIAIRYISMVFSKELEPNGKRFLFVLQGLLVIL
jgi:hypothetical protein